MIRVLIVEDDAAQVELTRATCAQQKLMFELDAVTTGEAALAFLRAEGNYRERERPDLLLIDLNLPGMSGIELLHALREDDALKSIPAVALSAVEPSRTVLTELKKHARIWVEKPIEIEGWARIVKAVPGLGLCLIKLPQ